MEFSHVSLDLCWPMISELPFSHKGGPSTSLVSCTRLRFPGGFQEDSQLETHLPWGRVTHRSPRTMADSCPLAHPLRSSPGRAEEGNEFLPLPAFTFTWLHLIFMAGC